MNTKELMKAMAQDVFGPRFQQELQRRYTQDTAAGRLGSLELEYTAAKTAIEKGLSPEQQSLLQNYESLAQQVRAYQGSFGFLGGLYCGFRQLLTPDDTPDGGFDQTVAQELMTVPRLNRHLELIRHTGEMEALLNALNLEEELVLSITCAWEQRAYSAAVHGFSLGYRMALELSDYIDPAPGQKLRMLGKLLRMEHLLGVSELPQVG